MKRRVALIGRTRLAVACLDVVLASGDEVVAVIPDASDDGRDGWQPSLRRAATDRGLPILHGGNVNDADFVRRVDELAPDFLLSFQAAPILRAPLIGTARIAALNLHYGPLPRYRGVSPIAWALLNGEPSHGVTLHVIEPGIDSGPIVTGTDVPIRPNDTGRTLYDRCVDAGIGLMADAWPTVRAQTAVDAVPQDEARALYYNRHAMDFADRAIHWTQDCETIANRIRAFIFPPFQYPEVTVRGAGTYAVRAMSWDRLSHRGRPGEILEVGPAGIVVAAPGGRITLQSVAVGDHVVDEADMTARGLVVGGFLV
ncbi:MAG: methionyl-tRNA formyltransferase [Candidatus Limnocylindria bacterium]